MKKTGGKLKLGKKARILIYALGIIFWVLVWYAAASLANRDLLLKIPLPLETVKILISDLGSKTLWQSVLSSMGHIALGYIGALILGIALGLASGKSEIFKAFTSPVQHLVRAVPVAAFIIIAWLWIPSGILPSFISGLMVLPIIWSHTDAALSSIDEKYIEMAKVYGMNGRDIVFKIKLPLMSPQLRTGCITALGIAWKAGIAAEVICNPSGTLGALLQGAKASVEYGQVFSVTLMIVILSLIFENILKIVWKEQKK